jgi:hypothetical protein
MINPRRLDVIRIFALSALLMTPSAISWAQQRPPIADKMAKAHGLDSFGQVEGIRYTFNVERPGVNVSRSWEWNPKTDSVSYEGKDKDGKPVKASYQRSQATGVPEDIDANFLNDQYWLLLPFHVIWDTSATVTDEGMQKLPLGNGSGEKLVVKYPSDGGYSPGDTWDVYVGADGRVQEFVWHRGGTEEAQRRHCTLDRLQEGRTAVLLIGSSKQGRRRADTHFLFECGGQGDGIGKLDQRAMNIGGNRIERSAVAPTPLAPLQRRATTGRQVFAVRSASIPVKLSQTSRVLGDGSSQTPPGA